MDHGTSITRHYPTYAGAPGRVWHRRAGPSKPSPTSHRVEIVTAISYPLAERTLANGLRVIVSEDHAAPNVAVNLWVGVGSRHESPGRTGFAHLFEHLMFQGSRNVASGEHFSALMDEGARLNATTWFDRTNYFETVPTGALGLALWLEADRHGHLLDAVTQENLDNQRDVVKEEKRQRYDNVPYGSALIDIYATIFPEGHPYHHPTIGSMDDLDAATLDDVHAFFRAHYGPNNTVLTLVGDLTPEEGFAAAETYFGSLPPIELHTRPRLPQLEPLTEPVRVDRVGDVPNDRLYVAFRAPVDTTPDYLACQVAVDVLGGLASSRLAQRLVRTDETAVSVGGWTMGLVDGSGLSAFTVDVSAGADVESLEEALCEEIRRFIAEGPDEGELESVIADTERSWLSALASIEERADHISHHALLTGDPDYVNTFVDHLRAVTADDAKRVAARWLDPSSRAVVRYLAEVDAMSEPTEPTKLSERTEPTEPSPIEVSA
jgi:zinc protease